MIVLRKKTGANHQQFVVCVQANNRSQTQKQTKKQAPLFFFSSSSFSLCHACSFRLCTFFCSVAFAFLFLSFPFFSFLFFFFVFFCCFPFPFPFFCFPSCLRVSTFCFHTHLLPRCVHMCFALSCSSCGGNVCVCVFVILFSQR